MHSMYISYNLPWKTVIRTSGAVFAVYAGAKIVLYYRWKKRYIFCEVNSCGFGDISGGFFLQTFRRGGETAAGAILGGKQSEN